MQGVPIIQRSMLRCNSPQSDSSFWLETSKTDLYLLRPPIDHPQTEADLTWNDPLSSLRHILQGQFLRKEQTIKDICLLFARARGIQQSESTVCIMNLEADSNNWILTRMSRKVHTQTRNPRATSVTLSIWLRRRNAPSSRVCKSAGKANGLQREPIASGTY
jgi:hypothetical protein